MLTGYINAAIARATYRLLEDGSFFGEIPQLQDVWAHEATLEACRNRLQAVLEEWIVDQLYLHHQLPPTIDGFTLDPDRIDEQEIAEAHAALEEAEREGTVTWETVRAEIGT